MKFLILAQIAFEEISEPFGTIGASYLERNWIWFVSLVVGVLLGSVLKKIFKSKPKALPPVKVALQALNALKNSELSDSVFAEAVSELIRIYLENQYSLPALERTTPEFLALAADSEALGEELKDGLKKILEFSDMAKFAKYAFNKNEREELFNLSFVLLNGELELQNKTQS